MSPKSSNVGQGKFLTSGPTNEPPGLDGWLLVCLAEQRCARYMTAFIVQQLHKTVRVLLHHWRSTEDLPMSRVKFNVNTEYAYLQNFKLLTSEVPVCLPHASLSLMNQFCAGCFTKHQIERPVPVESLVKCKMQDNLEFLQWSKRYWDQYYPGGDYDAVARRKGSGAPPSTAPPQPHVASRTNAGTGAAARRGTTPTATSAARGKWSSGGGSASAAVVQENAQLRETVTGLERERDFYFSKLRDIELLIQNAADTDPDFDKDKDQNGLTKQIQQILYSTEVKFAPIYEMMAPRWRRDDKRLMILVTGGVWDTRGSWGCGSRRSGDVLTGVEFRMSKEIYILVETTV